MVFFVIIQQKRLAGFSCSAINNPPSAGNIEPEKPFMSDFRPLVEVKGKLVEFTGQAEYGRPI
ncbi:hypothetical protein A5320_01680 [Rheinheimera sp. SA_1]|nr:hypothetical protein A5320_01680 [Rheinheimera sp. SA_1]